MAMGLLFEMRADNNEQKLFEHVLYAIFYTNRVNTLMIGTLGPYQF